MKDQRINQLEKYLQEDPEDTFSLYALALELQELDPSRTRQLFDHLLVKHPDYEGTYYHAAAFFTEQGETDRAREIYEKGITVLTKKKSMKALHELQNAYQNFLFEEH